MKNLEGWQISAARCACRWGYRELAAEAGIALSTILRIEKMPVIEVSATGFKEKGKVPPETIEKLLAAFERAGFRLVGRTDNRRPRVEAIE
jgi:hypothetical protein